MPEEKPHEATPSRLAKARRDGDVPKSQDLGAVAALALGGFAMLAVLAPIGGAARAAVANAARVVPASDGRPWPGGAAWSPWPYVAIALCAAAVVASGLAGGLGSTYLQSGRFTLKAIKLEPKKLDPIAGGKRLVGRDAAIAALKAAAVAATVAVAALVPLRSAFGASIGATPQGLAELVVASVRTALVSALGAAALFAVVDVLRERAKWRKRLRMTFDELKREYKSNEGDPQRKGRRKQAHRALIRGSVARVRDAAFVVANPTHVAIALEYRPPEVPVPRVLVRAIDDGALEVRRLAREHGVPVVEQRELARALLASTDVGDFIPADAYGAVAAVVATLVREKRVAS